MKFTSGKWECTEYGDIVAHYENSDTDKWIATMAGDDAEAKGNARLIEAAPEMYKLVQFMAYGNCDDYLVLLDEARKLLARIDNMEASHA